MQCFQNNKKNQSFLIYRDCFYFYLYCQKVLLPSKGCPYTPYFFKTWETVFTLRWCVCSEHMKNVCQDKIRFFKEFVKGKTLWGAMKKGNREMSGDLFAHKADVASVKAQQEKGKSCHRSAAGGKPASPGSSRWRTNLGGHKWERF